jgi:hypothetical protein
LTNLPPGGWFPPGGPVILPAMFHDVSFDVAFHDSGCNLLAKGRIQNVPGDGTASRRARSAGGLNETAGSAATPVQRVVHRRENLIDGDLAAVIGVSGWAGRDVCVAEGDVHHREEFVDRDRVVAVAVS